MEQITTKYFIRTLIMNYLTLKIDYSLVEYFAHQISANSISLS